MSSLLSRLWRKFASASHPATPAAPAGLRSRGQQPSSAPRREIRSGIEPLEGRIAPAAIVNASTVSYTDVDGDLVTVKFSKPLFSQATTVAELNTLLESVFEFTAPGTNTHSDFGSSGPQYLQSIDVTKFAVEGTVGKQANSAAGVSITVTAKKALQADRTYLGDDYANVGSINATYLTPPTGSSTTPTPAPADVRSTHLGTVTIDGRLGEIDAGWNKSAVGVKSLVVRDLGPEAPASGTVAVLENRIYGGIGSLKVLEDVRHAFVQATSLSGTVAVGNIGSISIGHTLGGFDAADTAANSGAILAQGNIGTVKIGSGLIGDGIIGAGGSRSGSVVATGTIDSATVNGDILGGAGVASGVILKTGITGGIGTVKVSGDVRSDGAAGSESAGIRSDGTIKSIVIEGDLKSGNSEKNAWIRAGDTLGSVTVKGDVIGGGPNSAVIESDKKITSVTIGGDLQGVSGALSAMITSETEIGTVKIGGDVIGGVHSRSGMIASTGNIKSITITGSIIGGTGESSGSVHAGLGGTGDLGSITVGDVVRGGTGDFSGAIVAEGNLGTATVKGLIVDGKLASLQGGEGDFSGAIYSFGTIKSVTLTGDVTGGVGDDSASIQSFGLMKSVSIKGSVHGGAGENSATITSHDFSFAMGGTGDIGTVSISGALHGGTGLNTARIQADADITKVTLGSLAFWDAAVDNQPGATLQGGAGSAQVIAGLGADYGRIGSITVNGAVSGAAIQATNDIGSLTVKGSVTDSIISGRGQAVQGKTTDYAIKTISISGNVTNTDILAGYDLFGAVNGNAQISSVSVKGTWSGSNLVAGVDDGGDGVFGNGNDILMAKENGAIASRIGSVTIKAVAATNDATDNFGIVAEQIAKVKIGSTTLPDVATTIEDLTVREAGGVI